ncbi:MAG: gliding motility-associated-like protein [Crocinitomicaceae bacterium]|jgi:gliding motility-associated-like protein
MYHLEILTSINIESSLLLQMMFKTNFFLGLPETATQRLFKIMGIALLLLTSKLGNAQIICIYCYPQTEAISPSAPNLIQNGGFENNDCVVGDHLCPNSSLYSCDIVDWTVSGGGTATYATVFDNNYSEIAEGTEALYLGNFFCQPCAIVEDTSCYSLNDCQFEGVPVGYPQHAPEYGGSTGVSAEQTVAGLTIGDLYVFEFWSGGEDISPGSGIIGLDIGFGKLMLPCRPTPPFQGMTGTRFLIEFLATSTSHTFKFTNWGHPCYSCSEPVLDDVILYHQSDGSANVPVCDSNYTEPPIVIIEEDITIPNIFTPNTDNVNDSYQIGYDGLSAYKITIINRWGNVMFISSDKAVHWDGTSNGIPAVDGTYFYKIEVGENEYSGFLQLVR